MSSEKREQGGRRIVVAGGGIAGIELITRLTRHLGGELEANDELYLIDKSPIHTWKPMLHMFAAGSTTPEDQGISFVRQGKESGFTYIPGEITSINRKEKQLNLKALRTSEGAVILPARTFSYDYLILSLGGCTNDFGTEGVKEFAYTIDDLNATDLFHEDFMARSLRAATLGEKHSLVIVGAGATGVELAGELMSALERASSFAKEPLTNFIDVTVVHSDSRILPTFTPKISENAQKAMEKLGINVRTNEMVVKVTDEGVYLKSGERLSASMTVWTAGVKALDLMKSIEGVTLSRSNQLVVDEFFQSIDDSTLFALGDCSLMEREPLPPTAQVARQQALYLGRHLPSLLRGEKPPKPFNFKDSGALVSVGRYASFGVFGATKFKRISLKGIIASIMHRALYRMHQVSILGLWRAFCAYLSDKFDRSSRRW